MKRLLPIFVLALGVSCASEPGARSLDDLETDPPRTQEAEPAPSRLLTEADARPASGGDAPVPAVPPPSEPAPASGSEAAETEATPSPAVEGTYRALEHKDVLGGRFSCEMAGDASRLATLLLDFEAMAGHRAWARRFEVLETKGDIQRVRWHFEGKAGVNPAPVLAFQVRRREPSFLARFRIVEEDFGLAAFFGDYLVEPLAEGPDGPRLRFTQRVYIDSGLWIANASAEEIEAGLREDARLLRDWLQQAPSTGE